MLDPVTLTTAASALGDLGSSGMFGGGGKTSSAKSESSGYFAPGDFNLNKPGISTWLLIAGAVTVLYLLTKGK